MFFWQRHRHTVSDEALNAYVDGSLEGASRARLESHLEGCAACRETMDELRALRLALGQLPRAAVPRSFALREADVHPQRLGRAGFVPIPALAALSTLTVVALLAFGTLVGIDVTSRQTQYQASTAAPLTALGEARAAAPQAEAERPTPAPSLPATAQGKAGASEEATRKDAASQFQAAPAAPEPSPPAEPTTAPATTTTPATSPTYPTYPACDACGGVPSEEALRPALEPTQAVAAEQKPTSGGPRLLLRVAEVATAAVALLAGASLAALWQRRRR